MFAGLAAGMSVAAFLVAAGYAEFLHFIDPLAPGATVAGIATRTAALAAGVCIYGKPR